MFRQFVVLSSVIAIWALGGAGAAQAQTGLTCVFEGRANVNDGHGHGIENSQPDALDPVFDVERGSFAFASGGGPVPFEAVCGGVVFGVPLVAVDAVITSSGFYDNIVCGTGFAHDLDGNSTRIDLLLGTVSLTNIGYEIMFRGGEGEINIGPDGAPSRAAVTELLPPDSHAPTHGPDGVGGGMHGVIDSSYTGEGEVDITPVAPDNCATAQQEGGDPFSDTDAFLVEGSFTLNGV
jgi:hypothetical protein